MDKKLKAEIWEIQVILYWILATQLKTYSWIWWVVIIWSFISMLGTFAILIRVGIEEKIKKESHIKD